MIPSNLQHENQTTTKLGTCMTIEQHMRFGEIALAALIAQHDSIILTPEELAHKVWAIADAVSQIYITTNGLR